jgi:hypothetical protein
VKKFLTGLIAALLIVANLSAPAALAAPQRLGEDPSGDAPPGLDITYLEVDNSKDSLEIRIGLANMPPVLGGYPDVPAIEWIFTTGKRTFIAEAVVGTPSPSFYFFELKDDSFEQLDGITGSFDWSGGFVAMEVPLKSIGAKKGTLISGVREPLDAIGNSGADVDVHVHTTGYEFIDEMTSERNYRIR